MHPVFDGYMRKDDLERELRLAHLSHLMLDEDGARKAFFREIKNIMDEYGVMFKVEKDTRHEILWSIWMGRSNYGSYMVVYNTAKYRNPVWAGSKSRNVDKTKDKIAAQTFADIVLRLNETLSNHAMNSYSFHQKTRKWLGNVAEMKLPRSTTIHGKTNNTEDYLINVNYLNQIQSLSRIYSLFNMSLTYKEVTV